MYAYVYVHVHVYVYVYIYIYIYIHTYTYTHIHIAITAFYDSFAPPSEVQKRNDFPVATARAVAYPICEIPLQYYEY